MISDSQSVFTKVVRPVPDAPGKSRELDVDGHNGARRERLTDDHYRELDSLLDILSARGHDLWDARFAGRG